MSEVALDLFLRDGYDATTMEQIAERAEVGTSTLYRYFPTKDQLLLDPLIEAIDPSPHLRARPAAEPLDVALGRALLAAVSALDAGDARVVELRRIVDAAPVVRAKLWDRYRMLRDDLEQVIADRTGASPTDLSVRATAGVVLDVFHLVDRRPDDPRTAAQVLGELLGQLASAEIVRPRADVAADGC